MNQRTRGILLFIFSLAVIAWFWLACLPEWSELDFVRSRIEGNRRAGINPTAVFYTEHPCMADIERKMSAVVESSSQSFWRLSH